MSGQNLFNPKPQTQQERNDVLRINPGRLVGEVIVEARTVDTIFLVQLSHKEYLAASALADRLQIPINDFLLWWHVPYSGVEIARQTGSPTSFAGLTGWTCLEPAGISSGGMSSAS